MRNALLNPKLFEPNREALNRQGPVLYVLTRTGVWALASAGAFLLRLAVAHWSLIFAIISWTGVTAIGAAINTIAVIRHGGR